MLRVVVLLFLLSTVTADRLSSLLSRMGNLEHRVDVLDETVDDLKAKLLPEPESQVEFALKITNVSASCDTECKYTVLYETKEDQPIVSSYIHTGHGLQTRLENQASGTLQFTTALDVVSPIVAISTSASTDYMLILLRPGGPQRAANFSNVAFSPVPPITFKSGDHPEFDFSTNVVGDRKVKRQELAYYVVPLYSDHGSEVTATKFAIESGEGDGGNEQKDEGPLRVVESNEDGHKRSYRFRLDTGYGDAGLLQMERVVYWDCTGGCTLYMTVVHKLVLYYSDDIYEVSDGDFFPHPIGQPAQGNYVKFMSFGPDADNSYTFHEGQTELIGCSVLGDGARLFWNTGKATNATESSVHLGHSTITQLLFQPVTKEDEGEYECRAESGNVHLSKTFTVRVTDYEEYGNYTGLFPDEEYGNYTDLLLE